MDGNLLTADLLALYTMKKREIFGSKWRRCKVLEWPLAWACLTLGSRKDCQHLDKYHRIKCTSSTWQDSSSDNVIKKKNTHNYVFPASMETSHVSFMREMDYENLPGCLFALKDTFMHFTRP